MLDYVGLLIVEFAVEHPGLLFLITVGLALGLSYLGSRRKP